jgi:Flp pilus assembly protein TadD
MRMTPVFAVAAAVLVGLTSAAPFSPAGAQTVDPNSAVLQAEGERLVAAGELENAVGFFETALVADPRNASAYVGLGRVAVAQSLPGKAIGYFREALALQPSSRSALAGQGAAYVGRGAVDRARANLVRIQTLCGGDPCPEASELAAVINAAGARTVLRPSEVTPRPVVEAAPPSNN